MSAVHGRTSVWTEAFSVSEAYAEDLSQIIANALRHPQLRKKSRVYKDGALISTHDLCVALETRDERDSGRSLIQDNFGGQNSCIILNTIETGDEAFAQAAARYIRPYVQRCEHAPKLAFGTFSGQYPFSPIGIHQDLNIDRALHFHIGPGTKHIYSWDEQSAPRRHIARYPDEEAVRTSAHHIVSPGDILNIETPVYHIGAAQEFSFNLALLFRRPTRLKRLEAVLNELGIEEWTDRSFARVMDDVLRIDHGSNLSNGGLAGRPMRRTGTLSAQAKLSVRHPDLFPVHLIDALDGLVVAARGRIKFAPNTKGARQWLSALALNETVNAQMWMDEAEGHQDRLQRFEFLHWLHTTGAVSLEKHQ